MLPSSEGDCCFAEALMLQAMAEDERHRKAAAARAVSGPPLATGRSVAATISRRVSPCQQSLSADTAVEALRQLQLAPSAQHATARSETAWKQRGHAVDGGDGECSSPLSPEAVAKLCCDNDEEAADLKQQFGSPESVLGPLQLSRACSSDGGGAVVGHRAPSSRALPGSGLGCGILGASAVWGL